MIDEGMGLPLRMGEDDLTLDEIEQIMGFELNQMFLWRGEFWVVESVEPFRAKLCEPT
jgi:hypothetical protein